MLDTTTKRRIDTARDILVGKIPDPKSQVEQITIALIYKFMGDMDLQAEEFGGQRTFFSGDLERYGWSKLVRSGLGGHEVINLYAEAIQRMPQNPNIPELFRSIFRNAFLPYRDPETLRAFLKVIDEFEYDHSERLGDAFEYLLLVLGSQGDAGQFRTPRHIIDLIVEIVNPQKTDVILDPACGTAGFLISAYKHILRENSTDPLIGKPSKNRLNTSEEVQLAQNIRGYDISPDMVRLSLVNMYLHGFAKPQIVEYDTLTSEERWNEYADVILANPPFMSPKGGIRPHNRFSIQSKRSEVLFVDYILEHLSTNGRAGIIVPEGIIFQSQTAYKNLRKLLVEEALIAVISLPTGVFNPYSGVKTSILILDKALAKKSNTVGFFKINHDGFSLGSQRRAGGPNDLPSVLEEIKTYRANLASGGPEVDLPLAHGHSVEKMRIAAVGDYNLSGERYSSTVTVNHNYPMVPLSTVLRQLTQVVTPSALASSVRYIGLENVEPGTGNLVGDYFVETPSEIRSTKKAFAAGNILYGKLRPNLNKVILAEFDGICSTDFFVLQPAEDLANGRLYEHLLRSRIFNSRVMGRLRGAQLPRVSWSAFSEMELPLPPIDQQHEIAEEIEGYQKVIHGARAVVENYRPHIAVDPSWPMVELGEIADFQYGHTASAQESGDTRFIRITDIMPNGSLNPNEARFINLNDDARKSLLEQGDILVARTGATFGKTMIFESDVQSGFASFLIRIRFRQDTILPRFYWGFAQSAQYWTQANALVTGGGQPQFNANAIKRILVPVPPIKAQRELIAEIEAEQQIVDANKQLIDRMQHKIDATISRIWGESADTN
jgi:type I restriction enzyme M protein